MEKKTDRRVKYTLMVIRESFVKLLERKPISKITVKEICEEADINRATFYAHFNDPYDLLGHIETELTDGIIHYLSSYDFTGQPNASVEMLEKILMFIRENAKIFHILLNTSGDMHFQQEVVQVIGQQHFSDLGSNRDDSESIFLFFASGSIGLIQKWLKDGMQKPAGELAELIIGLATNGISRL